MFFKSFNPATDLNDLTGKVIIVTGANTGIGYTTVKHLARKGAKVYLGSRSEEKGAQAAERLQEEGIAPGEVVPFWCDIGSLSSAKKSAEGFLALEDRLDVLVNNAACAGSEYGVPDKPSEDGITEASMTNHFATVQFMKVLLPLLTKTAEVPGSDVRIVTVSSIMHAQGPGANPIVNFKTLDEFKKRYDDAMIPWMPQYSTSKLAGVTYAKALQRSLTASNTNIACITLHPGVVLTNNYTRFRFRSLFWLLFWLFGATPDKGAYTSCFAAASPVVREPGKEEKFKGAYLTPVGVITKPAPAALNEQIQDDLWETTEKYLAEHA